MNAGATTDCGANCKHCDSAKCTECKTGFRLKTSDHTDCDSCAGNCDTCGTASKCDSGKC